MNDKDYSLEELLQQAEEASSYGVGGNFVEVQIDLGYWGYIKGAKWPQFFGTHEHGGAVATQNLIKSRGGRPGVSFRLTQFAETSLTEWQPKKDKVFYVNAGEFPWSLWKDHTFNTDNPYRLTNDLSNKRVWAHIKNARHPDFDENDPATHTRDTVWWDSNTNQPKLGEDGKIQIQYYPYVAAVFSTREELLNYAIANGVAVVAGEPTFTMPVPAGWLTVGGGILTEEDWEATLPTIVKSIQDTPGAKPLVVKKLLNGADGKSGWAASGLTEDDLSKIYDAVMGVPF